MRKFNFKELPAKPELEPEYKALNHRLHNKLTSLTPLGISHGRKPALDTKAKQKLPESSKSNKGNNDNAAQGDSAKPAGLSFPGHREHSEVETVDLNSELDSEHETGTSLIPSGNTSEVERPRAVKSSRSNASRNSRSYDDKKVFAVIQTPETQDHMDLKTDASSHSSTDPVHLFGAASTISKPVTPTLSAISEHKPFSAAKAKLSPVKQNLAKASAGSSSSTALPPAYTTFRNMDVSLDGDADDEADLSQAHEHASSLTNARKRDSMDAEDFDEQTFPGYGEDDTRDARNDDDQGIAEGLCKVGLKRKKSSDATTVDVPKSIVSGADIKINVLGASSPEVTEDSEQSARKRRGAFSMASGKDAKVRSFTELQDHRHGPHRKLESQISALLSDPIVGSSSFTFEGYETNMQESPQSDPGHPPLSFESNKRED